MSNFIISYDLNGQHPTHAEMDKNIEQLGEPYARILETVWYVGSSRTVSQIHDYVNSILSENDSLLVIEGDEASFRNLLIDDQALVQAWGRNR